MNEFIKSVANGKHGEEYKYMFLSRLQSDVKYYFGYGNRHGKCLWTGNITGQLDAMQYILDSFEDTDKPEWLTDADMAEYRNMI